MATSRLIGPSGWSAIFSQVGPDPQARLWPTLSRADRVVLVKTATTLAPEVVADIRIGREETVRAALATRTDLDAATLDDLADDPSPRIRENLEANPAALTMLRTDATAPGRLNVARASYLAACRPVGPGVLELLLRDTRTTVRVALASNPTLTSSELGTVLDLEPHEKVAQAVLNNPAAGDDLCAQILAGRGIPPSVAAGSRCQDLARQLLGQDPARWLPVVLRVSDPARAALAVPYLSLLTPTGQTRLVWAVTRTDPLAATHLRHLYTAAGMDPALVTLIGGWLDGTGTPRLSVAEFDTRLAAHLDACGHLPDVAAVVADDASDDLLAGEVRDSAWGRRPLHLAAARRLPWPAVLEALDGTDAVSAEVLQILAGHPHAPAALGHRLLDLAPRLLIDAGLTRREHVVAALADPRVAGDDKDLAALLAWGLPAFDIDGDTLAATVAPVTDLLVLVAETGRTVRGVAWAERVYADLAARTAAVIGNDTGRMRLLEAVGGAGYPGTFDALLATVSGLAAAPGDTFAPSVR